MKFRGRVAALSCAACWLSISLTAAAPDSKLAGRWLLSQWHRRVWQIEDGLPHNYVTAISHDSERYQLVGTQAGLARFDGMRFTQFPALNDIWIYSLLQASDGALWVGTYQHGLYRVYKGHVEQWGPNKGFRATSVYSIVEDKKRCVWLASESGLHRIDHDRVNTVIRGANTNGYAWQSVTVDRSGSIWFAAANGLFRYAAGASQPIHLQGVNGTPTTVYFRNVDDRLYLGTVNGLYILNCAGDQCRGDALRTVNGPIVGIRGATDGALWVATWGRGLYRLTRERVEQLSTREGLADDFVRTITEDGEHNIWVGTRGGGLTRFRATALKPVGMPEGLGGNCASVAAGDGRDGVWLGTWRSGLFHWRNGHLRSQPLPEPSLGVLITALALDNSHKLWIGSLHNLWVLSHLGATAREVRLPGPDASISLLLFSRKHELWLARDGQGISLFPSGDPRTSTPVRKEQFGLARSEVCGKQVQTRTVHRKRLILRFNK
jgi:ligand-binding sensor domain-containing protein